MKDDVTFIFATAGASATARETEEGFVVLAGSTARRMPTDTFPAGDLALRDQLLSNGKLTDGPASDLYIFTADVVFTSPSAAASVAAACRCQWLARMEDGSDRPNLQGLEGDGVRAALKEPCSTDDVSAGRMEAGR